MNNAANQLVQNLKNPVSSERELELSSIADEIHSYLELDVSRGEAYDQATIVRVEEIQASLQEELSQVLKADEAAAEDRALVKARAIVALLTKAEADLNSILTSA